MSRWLRFGALTVVLAAGMFAAAAWSGPSGTPTTADTARREGAAAAATRYRGPVLAFTMGVDFWCFHNGLPNLVAYADGTVLTTGVTRCDLPQSNQSKQTRHFVIHHVTPEAVKALMTDLRATGVFDRTTFGTNAVADADYLDIDAFIAGKRVSVRSYPIGSGPTLKAKNLVHRFIRGLEGGARYRPHGYEIFVRDIDPTGIDPDDFVEWPAYEEVQLEVVSVRGGIAVVPPQYGPPLAKVGRALDAHLVHSPEANECEPECPGHYVTLAWRPLLPHE